MKRRVALVSDTHGLVRPEVLEAIEGVDLVLHAGDVGHPSVLEALASVAPVRAVRGNVDRGPWAERLPHTDVVDVFGRDVFVLHALAALDLDPAAAGIALVLFGHSHEPADEERDGVRYVNPGACGPRRFSLPVSLALLDEDFAVEFVTLD